MTNRDMIAGLVRSTYAARVRGDLDGTMVGFADDAVFEFNGRSTGLPGMAGPVEGEAALRRVMQSFIDNFRFNDWQEISLIVDGDTAALHWRATVTTKAGKSAVFDVFDLITVRDGKIATFRQSTDTALVKALVGV